VDISTHGAKVRTKALLKTGTTVQLELVPHEGPLLRVGALVWRVDADGLALLFSHESNIDFSAQPSHGCPICCRGP